MQTLVQDCGRLQIHPHLRTEGGVYLWVLEQASAPWRIVYVGEGARFYPRLRTERKEFMDGRKTIWRPGPDEDVYALMRCLGNQTTYYQQPARDRKVFVPDMLPIPNGGQDSTPLGNSMSSTRT